MNDPSWLESEALQELIRDLVDQTSRSYRIEREDAQRLIRESLAACGALREAAQSASTAAQLRRTRACKQAMSEAKRKVYYHLRSYKPEQSRLRELARLLDSLETPGTADKVGTAETGRTDETLGKRPVEPCSERTAERTAEPGQAVVSEMLGLHASTRERLDQRGEFYEQVLRLVSDCRSIVDLGCGVHPLMFPFQDPRLDRLETYLALDSDRLAVECVRAFARWRGLRHLLAAPWDLAEGWTPVGHLAGRDRFDLALMMKLVPVVARQRRDLLPILARTPACCWLLTGSCLALTRQTSIERRERRVLHDFVALSGRRVQAEFTVGEEFALLVV